jgi:putative protein kinase ArgK-like GTPase of G3E family
VGELHVLARLDGDATFRGHLGAESELIRNIHGIAEVAESIARHAAHLHETGDWSARDRARLGSEMEALLREALMDRFFESIQQEHYEEMMERVLDRNISPYEAVKFLLNGK